MLGTLQEALVSTLHVVPYGARLWLEAEAGDESPPGCRSHVYMHVSLGTLGLQTGQSVASLEGGGLLLRAVNFTRRQLHSMYHTARLCRCTSNEQARRCEKQL